MAFEEKNLEQESVDVLYSEKGPEVLEKPSSVGGEKIPMNGNEKPREEKGSEHMDTPLEMKPGSTMAESRGEVWVEAKDMRKESALERAFEVIRSWMPKRKPAISSTSNGVVSTADADEIAKTADAEERVKKLINLALVRGVPYAVQVARHIDNYTLDRTHDDLADKFYEELEKRGMVKEIEE